MSTRRGFLVGLAAISAGLAAPGAIALAAAAPVMNGASYGRAIMGRLEVVWQQLPDGWRVLEIFDAVNHKLHSSVAAHESGERRAMVVTDADGRRGIYTDDGKFLPLVVA